MRFLSKTYILLYLLLVVASCSPVRHLPDEAYLLNKVKVKTDPDIKHLRNTDWSTFFQQTPSSRIQVLNLYNYSGKDTTKFINRFLRKAGYPPVVYDSLLTERTEISLENFLKNRGYLDAAVSSTVELKKKRARVTYHLKGNAPYRVNNYDYAISDDNIRRYIEADSVRTLVKPNLYFDVDLLNGERDRITTLLRNHGYYYFNRDFLRYEADSTNRRIDVALELLPALDTAVTARQFNVQLPVRKVTFFTAYDPISGLFSRKDSTIYNGYTIYYEGKSFLRPSTLLANNFIREKENYAEWQVERTRQAFNALPAVRFVNIHFVEIRDSLNCFILLSSALPQSYSVSVEGTNSGGDFGFASSVGYSHNNIFKGSEVFNMKFRAAYEGLSSNIQNLLNDNFIEIGGNTSLTFPRFMFPFLSNEIKRRSRAQTEFLAAYNYQSRPEFVRNISELTWRYKWHRARSNRRHTFDLIDVNYVYLPWISDDFKAEFINTNSILRYSYEDHLILKMGYVYSYNNSQPGQSNRQVQSLRVGVESGGNFTYLGFRLFGSEDNKNANGAYQILNTPFSQYAKVDFDYAKSTVIDSHNTLAWHVGLGVACPYLNSQILPFEKRYYAGGANSVRGWSVRTLGPGIYAGNNNAADLMVQSGDIRLDLNLEYRTKLFWIMELGSYIDAGNVWTIRNYDSQPGGLFEVNKFYEQIAVSYGLGLRFDFNFFLIRLDSGMKAYNPAEKGNKRWAVLNPNLKDNFAIHFAIGYPF